MMEGHNQGVLDTLASARTRRLTLGGEWCAWLDVDVSMTRGTTGDLR